jgi:hypothetical protein
MRFFQKSMREWKAQLQGDSDSRHAFVVHLKQLFLPVQPCRRGMRTTSFWEKSLKLTMKIRYVTETNI